MLTLEDLKAALANAFSESMCFVLVDENTRKYCLPRLLEQCPTLQNARIIEVCSGEQHKNLQTFSKIIEQLSEAHADRQSVLINLGGGVICDMGGFAAACYKRGIDFINIPTTLLAMVDAAHGGKTGIDFANFKNQVGVFAPAKMMVIDVEFLNTLPKDEILSGFAEIVKIALLTSVDFWNAVKQVDPTHLQALKPLISQAIERKMQIVKADPTEQHVRKTLNFGHTFGHAFETFALENDRQLSHGNAVAMGILCELWLSEQLLNFDSAQRREIADFITSTYPKFPVGPEDFARLLDILLQDKKNSKHQIRPLLLEKIALPRHDLNCSKEQCSEAFQMYNHIIPTL